MGLKLAIGERPRHALGIGHAVVVEQKDRCPALFHKTCHGPVTPGRSGQAVGCEDRRFDLVGHEVDRLGHRGLTGAVCQAQPDLRDSVAVLHLKYGLRFDAGL